LPEAKQGYAYIAGKFDKEDAYGPTSVRNFVEETDLLKGRTADQWQTDAFGQVQALPLYATFFSDHQAWKRHDAYETDEWVRFGRQLQLLLDVRN
jgi:hypothetical protein